MDAETFKTITIPICISTLHRGGQENCFRRPPITSAVSTPLFQTLLKRVTPSAAFIIFPSLSIELFYEYSRISASVSSEQVGRMTVIMADEENKDKKFDSKSGSLLVKELRKSFGSGVTKSYEWRVAQLNSIFKMMDENESEIAEALAKDLSKHSFETFFSEISFIKTSCKVALKELKHWMKPEKVKTSITTFPASAEIVSEPLGVVLVISTWNYPIMLSLDPMIGAIAAGNAVVLKPSEIAPASSSLLARFIEKYLDTSSIRVVEGAVPETAALLEQKWDKIFYTGVLPMESGHATMGKLALLLITLLPTKAFGSEVVLSFYQVDALRSRLEEFYGKDPMESKEISRVVNSNHFARLTKFLDEDKVSDKIVYGGQRDEKRLKIAPTILLDVPQDSLIMQEEIFGPLLPIVTVDNLEESFDLILSKDKPLAAYLFTKDKKLEQKFVSTISSGGMIVNDTVIHLTAHTLPFGGVGESGVGAYHGKFSFDAFSHKKAVMYRGFVGDAPIRISASLSFEQVGKMADEENKNKKFDSESASVLVKELRKSFGSGVTKSYEWRVAQINSIIKMMDENESEIAEALAKDLSKPKFESFVAEISMTKTSCKLALKELKHWMKPQKVKTEITTFPSSAEIVSEPLGVVLVISTWNYPILLSLDPIIGAVAAGNAVVLKPSEIAPKAIFITCKIHRKIPRYFFHKSC
ncbi:hypothetical protein IFM89_039389 [Coptis chinensis]|uniref:aldehyde dehydrogenase (NAD(+)) n=1 Tax=Coptis chinensis TaxID=261450 RepID=A0A835I9F0_9MAGN|nr:hypothetical protein IFM89_039389 [Coptis chinensis]